MATNLTIAVNTGLTDESYETSSAEWTIIDTANDYIIFTKNIKCFSNLI